MSVVGAACQSMTDNKTFDCEGDEQSQPDFFSASSFYFFSKLSIKWYGTHWNTRMHLGKHKSWKGGLILSATWDRWSHQSGIMSSQARSAWADVLTAIITHCGSDEASRDGILHSLRTKMRGMTPQCPTSHCWRWWVWILSYFSNTARQCETVPVENIDQEWSEVNKSLLHINETNRNLRQPLTTAPNSTAASEKASL